MKRKRGSGGHKPKKTLEAGAKKASVNLFFMNLEGCSNCGDLENDARREDEATPAHSIVRDQIAGLQDPLIFQKGNGGNSAHESNLLKNVASSGANLSRAGSSSSTGLCTSARPLQAESVHVLHQDLQCNEKEFTAALLVIKKIIKMDAAQPFNVPVDPAALGIPCIWKETPLMILGIQSRKTNAGICTQLVP